MNDLENLNLFEQQERIKHKIKKEFREKELNEWASAIFIILFIFCFIALLGYIFN